MLVDTTKLILPGIVLVILVLLGIIAVITVGQKMSRSWVEPEQENTAISSEFASEALRQYYVKSSYNSCAAGDYNNDYVSLAALVNAIKNGCRFLDFEIYDVENEPVVAVSSSPNYNFKGSYNSIPLNEVFQTVNNTAFKSSDPLFLQLRIKCSHVEIANKVAKLINDNFIDKVMEVDYNYENMEGTIAEVPLEAFMNRVAFIVDMRNPIIEGSELYEYVNIAANTNTNYLMTFDDLAYNAPNDILDFSTSNLLTIIPDLKKQDNYNSTVGFNQGAQFIAMKFQENDANLELYKARFDGYSFLLKPTDLQYVPNLVKEAGDLPNSMNSSSVMDMINAGANTVVTSISNLKV